MTLLAYLRFGGEGSGCHGDNCGRPSSGGKSSQSLKEQPQGKCYACDRPLRNPVQVDTEDNQKVWVGSDCAGKIKKTGESGYKPPLGGPRLYPVGSNKS